MYADAVAAAIMDNAIKMVVPFLVFFSIASGISGFGDLRDLGRAHIDDTIFHQFASAQLWPMWASAIRGTE